MQKFIPFFALLALTFSCAQKTDAPTDPEPESPVTEITPQAEEPAAVTPTEPENNVLEEPAPKTTVNDPATIDHPIQPGKHAFTLQWIGWDEPGSVNVEFLEENKYRVVGNQIGEGNDYAAIDGVLTFIGNRTFRFDGQLESLVSYVNNGELCVKEGPLHFRATGTRKYWRLKEMDNCEGNRVVDYFDIYF